MAITVAHFDTLYMGLSSDTKPDDGVSAGIRFFETDSGDVYIYDGADWVLEQSASNELTAGEAHIGQVGGHADIIEVTLTIDTAAYVADDVLSATVELASVLRAAGQPVLLTAVQVLDEDDEGGAFDIHFFNADTNIGTLNGALGMTDAEARTLIGTVRVTAGDYIDLGGQKMAWLKRGDSGFKAELLDAASGTSIWMATVSQDTKTYTAATDIKLRLHVVKT